MENPRQTLLQVLVVAIAVLLFFLAFVYLDFGTRVGSQHVLLTYLAVGALVSFLVLAWTLSWRQRVAGMLLLFGIVGFAGGIYWGSMGCNDLKYPADAGFGMSYDWETGRLAFGDYTPEAGYRCQANPNLIPALLGYLGTAAGGVLATTDFQRGRQPALSGGR